MKVTTYRTLANGKPAWVVAWTEAGQRRRKYYPSKAKAAAARTDKEARVEASGSAWLDLSPKQRNEMIDIFAEIKALGLTLRQVWDGYRSATRPAEVKTLSEATTACLADKSELGVRPRYHETLGDILRRFAQGRSEIPVNTITAAECQEWINRPSKRGGKAASETRRGRQSKLKTFFSWCKRRRYVTENPIAQLGRIAVEQRPPVILTPDQVDRALRWVKAWKDFRPYLVLGLFCGIRPDEIRRLDWSQVDLDRGLVTIDAATSKVRRRRIVPIAERALCLLFPRGKTAKKPTKRGKNSDHRSGAGGPIWPGKKTTLRRRKRQLAKALGFAHWPADLLRHTAASYLMARDKDAGKVADMLGNSPGVLLTRYRELVSPEAAARFWACGK